MIGGLDHRLHGALRLRAHSRPRHTRSHRSHPAEGRAGRAPGRIPQAGVIGHLHRLRRAVRRGRPHHHDGRRVRLHDRAVLSSHQHRTPHAAGGGRRRRNVGYVCVAAGGGAALRRTPAVRMEAPQPDSRGHCQCRRCRDSPLHHRHGPAVPDAAARSLHRPARTAGLRAWWDCWRARSRRC